jgi:activator of 2-hydroxyglutaryl-CoA dehydratase
LDDIGLGDIRSLRVAMEGAVKAFSMKESLAGVSGDYKEVAAQLAKEAREC